MSGPDRIWLQDAGDYEGAAEFEVTWCIEPQDDGDTEYVRRDPAVLAMLPEVQALLAERDALRAEVEQLKAQPVTVQDAVKVPEVKALIEAVSALGAMPEGYCFCSENRVGDESKQHEPECRDLRAAIKSFGW